MPKNLYRWRNLLFSSPCLWPIGTRINGFLLRRDLWLVEDNAGRGNQSCRKQTKIVPLINTVINVGNLENVPFVCCCCCCCCGSRRPLAWYTKWIKIVLDKGINGKTVHISVRNSILKLTVLRCWNTALNNQKYTKTSYPWAPPCMLVLWWMSFHVIWFESPVVMEVPTVNTRRALKALCKSCRTSLPSLLVGR